MLRAADGAGPADDASDLVATGTRAVPTPGVGTGGHLAVPPTHGDPSYPTAWSRGRVLAPAWPHCPHSTHQGPGRVLGSPVAQLTLQLHVLCAPCCIPGQVNAVGLEGDGLDALQGWGVQLGCRKSRGELERCVASSAQSHDLTCILSMPGRYSKKWGQTTPKHLGEWLVARDRSQCVSLLGME